MSSANRLITFIGVLLSFACALPASAQTSKVNKYPILGYCVGAWNPSVTCNIDSYASSPAAACASKGLNYCGIDGNGNLNTCINDGFDCRATTWPTFGTCSEQVPNSFNANSTVRARLIALGGDITQGYCTCPENSVLDKKTGFCIDIPPPEPDICYRNTADGISTGHPIIPATGEKLLFEIDYADSATHPLTIKRTYSSQAKARSFAMGGNWAPNFGARLQALTGTLAITNSGLDYAVTMDNLSVHTFYGGGTNNNLVWVSGSPSNEQFTQTGSGYEYRALDQTIWRFNTNLKLVSQTQRNGWVMTYAYNSAGHLSSIKNQFGRSIDLIYDSSGRLIRLVPPDGRVVDYEYDGLSRLTKVSHTNNLSKSYLYENPNFPSLLTGVIDQNNRRLSTYNYDGQGRAIETQDAGGANRFQLRYLDASNRVAEITDPLGTARTYAYTTNQGQLTVFGSDKPSGQGFVDATNRVQNYLGLIESETDFAGFITTTSWDTARRLPTQVVKASGTPAAQTVQTQWHPTLRLPTLVTEVGRTTAMTYDTLGNKLTETITDTSVPPATPNAVRTSAWQYNTQSLVVLETAPNGATTSYTYDSAGNPLTMRNALGHITTMAYAGADGQAGRVTSMTAPNGVVSSYTYDPRGRLLSSTQAAGTSTLATLYTYTPSGQLASAALPSGHAITYSYDAAQRLTGWQDNRGATGAYTLDAMGNRTTEQIKNSAGQVVWQLARSINAINRVASETVGAAAGTVNSNQLMTYGYNANGSLTSEANGLQQATTYGLDGLRRVTQITNAANATAALTYNALDAVTSASDFKGVVTTTPRDALGNAVSTTSPDAGAQTAQYDALGLPKQIVDALGQATSITRDALGRPTSIVHADGRNTTLRYDLTGTTYNAPGFANASKGYLSEIADTTDNTKYLRDGFGRVIRKTQQLAPFTAGTAKNIQYTYASGPTGNGTGQLASITYPNGTKVSYVFSPAGQISQVNWGNNPLVANIQYTPLGLPASWDWQFADTTTTTSLTASRAYDTAGRVVATELGTYTYDAAGRITSLTQQLAKPANTTVGNSATTTTVATFTIGYDSLGRITSMARAAGTGAANTAPLPAQLATFTYDANGNRLTSSQSTGTGTTRLTANRSYSVTPASNQIQSFSQTLLSGTATSGVSSSVNYQTDANGAMLSDGLRRYEHDAANRMANVTTGIGVDAPTTRYVHNALGQRLFKTEPQFAPVATGSNPSDPGVLQTLLGFFSNLWGSTGTATASITPSAADKLGFAYYYDEDGSLLYEAGTGGASSTGSAHYVYLPTPAGPMPIAFYNGSRHYAVHTDHLNTPRRLTQSDKKVAWQWAFSAFGDEQPTTARNRFVDTSNSPSLGTTTVADVTFNLRYPGQYADKESGLNYNYFRSYSSDTGRYTQSDPIDLQGGWNRFGYANANPLMYSDPQGLFANIAVPVVIGTGILITSPGAQQAVGNALAATINAANSAIDSIVKACTGDPCDEIKRQIRDLTAQLAKRESQLAADQYDLINKAYSVNPGGALAGKGTYVGHVAFIDSLKAGLAAKIAQARAMGCL
jgi:RHS repeat-associated protein